MYAETGSHPSFVTRFLESHRHVSTSTVYRWETDPAKPQSPSSPPTQTTPSHVSVPYPFHPGGVEGPEPLPQHDIGNEELADPSLYQYGYVQKTSRITIFSYCFLCSIMLFLL